MPKASIYTVQVIPGDCGPDNIVMMHSDSRWMEAASEHYFCKAHELRASSSMDVDGRSKVLPVPQWIRSRCE